MINNAFGYRRKINSYKMAGNCEIGSCTGWKAHCVRGNLHTTWFFFALERKMSDKSDILRNELLMKKKPFMFKKFFRLSRYRVVRAESYVVRKLFAEKIKV